jgi:hypothetical protein
VELKVIVRQCVEELYVSGLTATHAPTPALAAGLNHMSDVEPPSAQSTTVTLLKVFDDDSARSNELPARKSTPPDGGVTYWPTVTLPIPCAVTVIWPALPVLVALAVPPAVVLVPLAQLSGGGGGGKGPEADAPPPQGGGAVLAACTVRVMGNVAVSAG